eukprot:XP_016860551.1 transmembrane protein 163 isoform X3 [Homo sapiens]
MEPAAGIQRRSSQGPTVPPPPRGHAPPAAAPGPAPLSSPVREPPQLEEERQVRISESGQFSDGLEDRGLLESSTRLKPHEAQNYRKKALWVSWFSIIVTLALAVAAFNVNNSPHWCFLPSRDWARSSAAVAPIPLQPWLTRPGFCQQLCHGLNCVPPKFSC